MASEYSIANIISFAKNSQVNTELKIAQHLAFNGGAIDPFYSRKIYLLRKGVEFVNTNAPTYSTLRQTAEYLFALIRPFVINAATISITNPSNETINVGQTASFSVSVFVSNANPYTIQWFRNNVAIPGATSTIYNLPNAQLSDNGATFYAVATSIGVGTAVSATVQLNVIGVITGFFAYSATTDYYLILLTNSDPFAYQVSFTITHNAAISIPLPGIMPANQFMLAKIPIGEPIKTTWFNTPLNSGAVPDAVFQSVVQFGGFTYYASRGQISMDVTQPLIFS